jgi:hypothetical protein
MARSRLPRGSLSGKACGMLFIAEPYRRLLGSLGLKSYDSMSRFFLGPALETSESVAIRSARVDDSPASPLDVFFKEYRYVRPSWRFVGRRSKARCEFDNYMVLSRLQVPAAEALAFGEDRDAIGRLRRAFILTRAIPDSQTLAAFLKAPARDRSTAATRALRRDLARQLAAMTRTIHDAHFYHHDLFWRNVLVETPQEGAPTIWWIDCPRGSFVRLPSNRRRRRLKDLASLDQLAERWCSRGERIGFIHEYLRAPRLDLPAKQLLRDVLAYRKRRWPGDRHNS